MGALIVSGFLSFISLLLSLCDPLFSPSDIVGVVLEEERESRRGCFVDSESLRKCSFADDWGFADEEFVQLLSPKP